MGTAVRQIPTRVLGSPLQNVFFFFNNLKIIESVVFFLSLSDNDESPKLVPKGNARNLGLNLILN